VKEIAMKLLEYVNSFASSNFELWTIISIAIGYFFKRCIDGRISSADEKSKDQREKQLMSLQMLHEAYKTEGRHHMFITVIENYSRNCGIPIPENYKSVLSFDNEDIVKSIAEIDDIFEDANFLERWAAAIKELNQSSTRNSDSSAAINIIAQNVSQPMESHLYTYNNIYNISILSADRKSWRWRAYNINSRIEYSSKYFESQNEAMGAMIKELEIDNSKLKYIGMKAA
jgi:hypothetical protein